MRQYEPIWNRIKTHNTASLVTHVNNEARIRKAVIKEKHIDEGYKLMLSDKALKATLIITREEDKNNLTMITLHFSLSTTIKDTYIGIDNL